MSVTVGAGGVLAPRISHPVLQPAAGLRPRASPEDSDAQVLVERSPPDQVAARKRKKRRRAANQNSPISATV